MKSAILAFVLIVIGLKSASSSRSELLLDRSGDIVIQSNGGSEIISAGEGKFWSDLIIAPESKRAFAILKSGSAASNSFDGLYEIVKEELGEPPAIRRINIVSELKDVGVLEIYSISRSGDRLLVRLHYFVKREDNANFYDSYPYIIQTDSGVAEKVAL